MFDLFEDIMEGVAGAVVGVTEVAAGAAAGLAVGAAGAAAGLAVDAVKVAEKTVETIEDAIDS